MPRGDRTGPWGQGPLTGRGAGYCSGSGAPGYRNYATWGRGGGYGRGFFGPPRFRSFFDFRPFRRRFFFGRGRW
ncbi:MAG: DUF5320 domain-containing protein [Candidatus Thermoplasmatota archaeon]|nr:DUF5320 domain-containing protein [Candidatus Thermoplasmatota archaeon]